MVTVKQITAVVLGLYSIFYFSTIFYSKKINHKMDVILKVIFSLIIVAMIIEVTIYGNVH